MTSDLSGPGSPPALLPGFRNTPPWGPERANQNEEEPQRAVDDWRRGETENINNAFKKCFRRNFFEGIAVKHKSTDFNIFQKMFSHNALHCMQMSLNFNTLFVHHKYNHLRDIKLKIDG